MWVLGTEFRSPDLATNPLTHWAILPDLRFSFEISRPWWSEARCGLGCNLLGQCLSECMRPRVQSQVLKNISKVKPSFQLNTRHTHQHQQIQPHLIYFLHIKSKLLMSQTLWAVQGWALQRMPTLMLAKLGNANIACVLLYAKARSESKLCVHIYAERPRR